MANPFLKELYDFKDEADDLELLSAGTRNEETFPLTLCHSYLSDYFTERHRNKDFMKSRFEFLISDDTFFMAQLKDLVANRLLDEETEDIRLSI